jgi:hypothetical protein
MIVADWSAKMFGNLIRIRPISSNSIRQTCSLLPKLGNCLTLSSNRFRHSTRWYLARRGPPDLQFNATGYWFEGLRKS